VHPSKNQGHLKLNVKVMATIVGAQKHKVKYILLADYHAQADAQHNRVAADLG
jgi:hypothetical protein